MPDENPKVPLFKQEWVQCPHCGTSLHTAWVRQTVKAPGPARAGNSVTVGEIYGTTCTNGNCGEPMMVMRRTLDSAKVKGLKPEDAYMVAPVMPKDEFVSIVVNVFIQYAEDASGQPLNDEDKAGVEKSLKPWAGKLWDTAYGTAKEAAREAAVGALAKALQHGVLAAGLLSSPPLYTMAVRLQAPPQCGVFRMRQRIRRLRGELDNPLLYAAFAVGWWRGVTVSALAARTIIVRHCGSA